MIDVYDREMFLANAEWPFQNRIQDFTQDPEVRDALIRQMAQHADRVSMSPAVTHDVDTPFKVMQHPGDS